MLHSLRCCRYCAGEGVGAGKVVGDGIESVDGNEYGRGADGHDNTNYDIAVMMVEEQEDGDMDRGHNMKRKDMVAPQRADMVERWMEGGVHTNLCNTSDMKEGDHIPKGILNMHLDDGEDDGDNGNDVEMRNVMDHSVYAEGARLVVRERDHLECDIASFGAVMKEQSIHWMDSMNEIDLNHWHHLNHLNHLKVWSVQFR